MISKSVSVQNLENLVRQTINAVPENNEDTIKFHQMIYEKWYFKRSLQSKSTKGEQNHSKSRITTSEQNISATATYRRSRQSSKHKHRINRSPREIQRPRTNVENLENVKNLFPRNNVLDSNNSHLDGIQLFSIDPTKIVDRPSVDVDSKVIGIRNSRKQRIKEGKNTRNNVFDVACTRDCNVGVLERHRKAKKKLITFEIWKRSKSVAHRKILKQLAKEKQNAFITLDNAKREMTIRKAQISYKRQQQHQRAQTYSDKFFVKSNCEQIKGKRVKFGKDKVATLITMRKSNNTNGNRKKQTASTHDSLESVIFYSWLDQLNWILYKKYLRERRHLVRSFYCQPLYYGDATLYVT